MSTNEALIDRLRNEAQSHAQEARTANATIAEIYRIVTEGTGEPGNWHGAEPVRKCIEELRAALAAAPAADAVASVARDDFDKMSSDLTRAKNLLVRLHAKHPEVRAQIEGSTGPWFVWGADRDADAAPASGAETIDMLTAALEMFVGDNATHSLCRHEGMDAIGRVKGTWSAAAEANARAALKILADTRAHPQQATLPASGPGQYQRMFEAACVDLGLINEALGLDPDDGGAEPILAAIAELKAQAGAQPQADAAEPVAWFAFGESNGPVPLELYGWDKKACLNAVLENARATGWKGTVNGYLFEKGWTVRPVWLHPYASDLAQPAPQALGADAEEIAALLGKYKKLCILAGRGDGFHLDRIDRAIASLAAAAPPAAGAVPPAASGPRLSDLRKAAHAGYMAACREVYALVEDTRKSSNIVDDFTCGRCFEAKGIARTMGAIGPENSEELREALGAVMKALIAAAPSTGGQSS